MAHERCTAGLEGPGLPEALPTEHAPPPREPGQACGAPCLGLRAVRCRGSSVGLWVRPSWFCPSAGSWLRQFPDSVSALSFLLGQGPVLVA